MEHSESLECSEEQIDTGEKVRKPKKAFHCRNSGCRVAVASNRSRERHESMYCKQRDSSGNEVTMPDSSVTKEYICRVPECNKQYGQVWHRNRHEQDSHRMCERRGRSVSPLRNVIQNNRCLGISVC